MSVLNYLGYLGTFAAGLLIGAAHSIAINAWRAHAAKVAANQEVKLQAAVKAELAKIEAAKQPSAPATPPTA